MNLKTQLLNEIKKYSIDPDLINIIKTALFNPLLKEIFPYIIIFCIINLIIIIFLINIYFNQIKLMRYIIL